VPRARAEALAQAPARAPAAPAPAVIPVPAAPRPGAAAHASAAARAPAAPARAVTLVWVAPRPVLAVHASAAARAPEAHARAVILARVPRPGAAVHALTAARAQAGLDRADCARAEGIRGAPRRPAGSAPLVARVPPAELVLLVALLPLMPPAVLAALLLPVAGVARDERGLRLAEAGTHGPAGTVPLRAASPSSEMEAGVGLVGRRRRDVRTATPRAAPPGLSTVLAAPRAGPAGLSTVLAAPKAGPAGPSTVLAAPRVLAEARALAGAKALLDPRPAAAECAPAMVVNGIGPRIGAPRRVEPTIAGPLRDVLGAKRPAPGFPRALPGGPPVVDPLRRPSRGRPGCVFPIRSAPSSLILA
jgi:hypothetical protein